MIYGYFYSLLNDTYPVQIHKAVLKKLRFEKEVKKILTLNISEIYGPIILLKELDRELPYISSRKNFETIKSILLP